MLLAYNMLMLAVDAAAIAALVRARAARGRIAALAAAGVAALLFSAVSGEGAFGQMRLLACALFVHGVILASAMALVAARRRRRAAAAWGLLTAILAAVGVDAFFVEPYWLQVTQLSLHSAKIERPVRIVALADFQTDTIGQFERDVLDRIIAERPDIILLVGDYIQVDAAHWPQMAEEFRRLLHDSGIAAPLGVYAVKGNVDPPRWTEQFRDSDVRLFSETTSVEVGGLRLTGLSQRDSLDPFLRLPAGEGFHVVFGHHPDYALSEIAADLLIAGHTHGGQVRVPLIGPLLTLSRVPRGWAAGVTDRGAGRTLVVSRGTGLERGSAPRLRFLCRPELIVIQLEPGQ